MPVLASNHPSFFFYVVKQYTTGPDKEWKNFMAGLITMRQDIVAACWQVEMGENPAADPAATLTAAQARWKNQDAQVKGLVVTQGGFKQIPPDPDGAAAKFSLIEADLHSMANDPKTLWMLDR
jgi:hypothetical protein